MPSRLPLFNYHGDIRYAFQLEPNTPIRVLFKREKERDDVDTLCDGEDVGKVWVEWDQDQCVVDVGLKEFEQVFLVTQDSKTQRIPCSLFIYF